MIDGGRKSRIGYRHRIKRFKKLNYQIEFKLKKLCKYFEKLKILKRYVNIKKYNLNSYVNIKKKYFN